MPRLSDSQLVVLTAACQRPDRCVFPVTAKLKGNAAGNVLKSLLNKGLIKEVRAKRDDTVWRHDKKRGRVTLNATRDAFAVLGIDEREATSEVDDDDAVAPSNDVEAATADKKAPKAAGTKPRRADSKQAQLIEMLKHAGGASIEEIVTAFGWQAHTVRGTIAGALKKKLGLDVISEKIEGRGRVYRIAA